MVSYWIGRGGGHGARLRARRVGPARGFGELRLKMAYGNGWIRLTVEFGRHRNLLFLMMRSISIEILDRHTILPQDMSKKDVVLIKSSSLIKRKTASPSARSRQRDAQQDTRKTRKARL